MNRVVSKQFLTPEIAMLEIEAPRIARRWKPGQFLIIRPTAESERIPLTLVRGDAQRGTITIVVQAIGKTTKVTVGLEAGDLVADVVGPLGEPATVEKHGRVLCIGGGVGVAELLPVAKGFREAGNHVTAICGARTRQHIILNNELQEAADEVLWSTDDGSFGFNGNVVQLMREWIKGQSEPPAVAHVIGPIPMMRFASDLTKEWGVRTFASLNPVMIDGTGMCGGCRVTVGGKIRFACVEGPEFEFDAHQVDFDELARRNRAYAEQERAVLTAHECKVGLGR
jgi:ferredoxin--NADP+ reductase